MLAIAFLSACAGEITGVAAAGTGGDGDGQAPTSPDDSRETTVQFDAPVPGSAFPRDAGANAAGVLVAAVAVEVTASAHVARLDVFIDEGLPPLAPAATTDGFELSAAVDLASDGARELTAVAFDRQGRELARATVSITVEAPTAATCSEWLDLYGVLYQAGPERPGIEEPVTVTPPINGIDYRYVTADAPRTTMLMDCSLALALARTAPSLHERNLVEVADIGIYNYRCIGNEGTPPECPRGMSQHAFANAIDIAGYTDGAGLFYSVNDDWVIDPDDEPTCEAATEPGADALLHDLICEQKSDGIWNIVLTPNYNAGHRNHFHVDLKDGRDFIELWGRPAKTDEGGPAH